MNWSYLRPISGIQRLLFKVVVLKFIWDKGIRVRGAISYSTSMAPATQREALPNDAKSLIRRLGEELSCSIWYIFFGSGFFLFYFIA